MREIYRKSHSRVVLPYTIYRYGQHDSLFDISLINEEQKAAFHLGGRSQRRIRSKQTYAISAHT